LSLYELAIIGNADGAVRSRLTTTLRDMVGDFGLGIGKDVVVHDGDSMLARDRHAAFAATYFGGNPGLHPAAVQAIVETSAPVIPTVGTDEDFRAGIPVALHASNGLRRRADDPQMTELASALLECVGLLRRQRRVFVSYRRIEARSAAMQLHDLLTARGFDVFLDTHDVRPGEPFQDVLWHRLCDSDVLVMLDTPTYFNSKWTRSELGRARAKEIHVLRVVWPDHTSNKQLDFGETVYLAAADLAGPDGPILDATADRIVLDVERLRSRSIASRYMSITGKLRADVERIGASIAGIGSHRAIAIKLVDEQRVWAYPVVGIPTAELLNDIADKAKRAEQENPPILVYDHVGISKAWEGHLQWLDDHIKAVKAVKAAEAGWALAGWGA
jgi:hypothetical protein